MKLKNTTDFPDWFLRRMISWVRQNTHIAIPATCLREVTVRNRSRRKLSGHAKIYERAVVISIGILHAYRLWIFDSDGLLVRDENGKGVLGDPDPAERIRRLVGLVAHELGHLAQFHRHRHNAVFSESGANWMEERVVEDFVANEVRLIAAWMKLPAHAEREKAPKLPKRLVRAKNALEKRDEWKTKLKRAEKKLKEWQLKVNYYQRNSAYDELRIPEATVLLVKKVAKKKRRRRKKVQS